MADKRLTPEGILTELLSRYAGTTSVEAWGETSVFYNPGLALPRGVYFATVKEKDGENDRASELGRDGVFRLNVGLPKPEFVKRFGPAPARPPKGGVVEGPWTFTALDQTMPHPVYGWMGWICVLNPTQQTFDALTPLIDVAYAKARASFEKRLSKS
ncbi:MAG: DUF6194 family protein [Pseudomonadota bacterium]